MGERPWYANAPHSRLGGHETAVVATGAMLLTAGVGHPEAALLAPFLTTGLGFSRFRRLIHQDAPHTPSTESP